MFLVDTQHYGNKVTFWLRNSCNLLLNPAPSGREMGQERNQTYLGSLLLWVLLPCPGAGVEETITNEGDQGSTNLNLKPCANICGWLKSSSDISIILYLSPADGVKC